MWMTPAKLALIRWGSLALGIIAVVLWIRFAPPTAPWSPHRIIGMAMPEPRVITKVEKVIVPGPERIKVIPKEKIVEYYNDLPTPATVADNAAVVIAVADTPPAPEGGTAISVLRTGPDNVATGHIEFQPKKAPFFAIKRAFSAEGWYFPAGNRVAEAALIVNPLRIGPVEVKAKVGADMERESSTLRGFVGVGVEIKF